MSTSNNARRLLNHQEVVDGSTGRQLAEFLIEFLPFEEEQWAIGESVRLILQPGLISEDEREKLWGQGKRKNTYLLGFLAADPDDLPEDVPASPLFEEASNALEDIAASGNVYARQLLRLLSPRGQAFLQTLDKVVKKPNNQDVVIGYLRVISHYFESTCPECAPQSGVNNTRLHELEGSEVDMQSLIRLAQGYMQSDSDEALSAVMQRVPGMQDEIEALLTLSMVSELVINPIFARTDAIGTLMRKKLEPVSGPILERTGLLQGRNKRRS
jgi:hypothetical protein